MPIVHLQGIQPVHQLRQALRPLFEKRFKGRDKFQLPAFRNATAGLPDKVVIIARLMDVAVPAFSRRRKLAAFRQRL